MTQIVHFLQGFSSAKKNHAISKQNSVSINFFNGTFPIKLSTRITTLAYKLNISTFTSPWSQPVFRTTVHSRFISSHFVISVLSIEDFILKVVMSFVSLIRITCIRLRSKSSQSFYGAFIRPMLRLMRIERYSQFYTHTKNTLFHAMTTYTHKFQGYND